MLYCRSPFFSLAIAEDVQGYLEGLEQVNGKGNLERKRGEGQCWCGGVFGLIFVLPV